MFEASSHMPSAVVSRRDLSLGFASLPPIDVRKIWSVLWRGKTTILLSTMVAVGLAALFVLLVPHKYTATTQILIDRSMSGKSGPSCGGAKPRSCCRRWLRSVWPLSSCSWCRTNIPRRRRFSSIDRCPENLVRPVAGQNHDPAVDDGCGRSGRSLRAPGAAQIYRDDADSHR